MSFTRLPKADKSLAYSVMLALSLSLTSVATAQAAEYQIDTAGAHASINFKIIISILIY